MTSLVTCSHKAVESTTIAFRPPVSAITLAPGFPFLIRLCLIFFATADEPVKATPEIIELLVR